MVPARRRFQERSTLGCYKLRRTNNRPAFSRGKGHASGQWLTKAMKAHFRWRAPSCLWNVILGLLLVTVYVTYFIFSNMVPPLECGIDHKPLGSFAEIHTKQFHETYLRKWRPEKFHSDPNKWKQCVKKEHPDYPSINEYTERPVVVWTWHTLENFLYIHQVCSVVLGNCICSLLSIA